MLTLKKNGEENALFNSYGCLAGVAACGGGGGCYGTNSNVTPMPAQEANFTGGGGVMTAVVDANAAGAAVAGGASGG